jgi:Ras of Complex, Roc, domain of DAPkinase
MNVWDFAGQIYYHSMHQTFFRPNCLYVLLLDLHMDNSGPKISTENAMQRDAQKWLNSIVSCAGPDIGLSFCLVLYGVIYRLRAIVALYE